MKRTIKIGTRTSQLAMAQTQLVIDQIKAVNKDVEVEIVPIKTLGDRILDRPLLSFGGKGAFVSEFETALLAGNIDLAVHSAKDMPMELPNGLAIVGVLEREDPRDVLITMAGKELPKRPIIGTSSLRRQLQIGELQEVTCEDLRGNINTRLRKLEEGQYDGIILAVAGLKRLGLLEEEKFNYHYFDCDTMIPAGGQGIIAIEGRADDNDIENLFRQITNPEAAICLETERSVLELLDAGCHEPIGVYSFIEGKDIHLSILYGKESLIQRIEGRASIKERIGLANKLVQSLKDII